MVSILDLIKQDVLDEAQEYFGEGKVVMIREPFFFTMVPEIKTIYDLDNFTIDRVAYYDVDGVIELSSCICTNDEDNLHVYEFIKVD